MAHLRLLGHPDVRKVLIIFLASTVGLALWTVSLSGLHHNPADLAFLSSGVAGIIILSGLAILLPIRRMLRWDHQLSAIARQGEDNFNPFDQENSAGCTEADHGWNRLIESAKSCHALHQLEQSISKQLQNTGGRTAPPLLDALSDGVATVDANGIITFANSSLAAISGAGPADALLGRSLFELFTSDSETAAALRTLMPQAPLEWNIETPAGRRILSGRYRPGRKSDLPSFAFVWTIRDVTQQRLAEAMRDQFLATATHEFRTPLANIRAYAESLHDSAELDTDSRKRFYNVIQSESVRLSQLVDDLLDISRMQAGALSLEPTETDLGRLAEEVAAKVQGELQSKGIEFQCELPPKLPPKIVVDKSKLSAALVNLLGNAAKYTPAGGKVTFRVDVAANRLQFQICDTGIGIASDELPHVFERFYRSSDDRVRELTGSGLGLALTQEVARLHGGEVTAESQLDQGSTFCMTIPVDSNLGH